MHLKTHHWGVAKTRYVSHVQQEVYSQFGSAFPHHSIMDSTSDPLLALRQSIKTKFSITYVANAEPTTSLLAATHIVLSPTLSLPKSTTTRYSKPGTSASSPSDFFTLEAVYLAWLLRDAPVAEYMKQARENGLAVGFVSVTERKSIVEWLEGKVNDLERIVPIAGACACKLCSGICVRPSCSR